MIFAVMERKKMITLNKDDAFTIVDIISKAQEIIRCKDCKYWEEDVPHNAYCEFMKLHGFEPDDFCSRGEKK